MESLDHSSIDDLNDPLLSEEVGAGLLSRRNLLRACVGAVITAGVAAIPVEMGRRYMKAERLKNKLENRSASSVLEIFPEGVVIGGVPLHVRKVDVQGGSNCLILLEMPPLSRGPYTASVVPPVKPDGTIDDHISPQLSAVITALHEQYDLENIHLDDRWWAYCGQSYIEQIHTTLDANNTKNTLAQDLTISAIFSDELTFKDLSESIDGMRASKKMNDTVLADNTRRAEMVLGGKALTEKVSSKALTLTALARPDMRQHQGASPEPFAHPEHSPEQIQAFLRECSSRNGNNVIVTRQPRQFEQELQRFNAQHAPAFSSVTLTPHK